MSFKKKYEASLLFILDQCKINDNRLNTINTKNTKIIFRSGFRIEIQIRSIWTQKRKTMIKIIMKIWRNNILKQKEKLALKFEYRIQSGIKKGNIVFAEVINLG